jgi:hypothetical protein
MTLSMTSVPALPLSNPFPPVGGKDARIIGLTLRVHKISECHNHYRRISELCGYTSHTYLFWSYRRRLGAERNKTIA